MPPTIRAFDARTEAHGELPRTLVATINTDCVDSYRTVIVPRGLKLDRYEKNRVVLLNHDQERVIGRNVWVKAQGRSIKAATQFLPQDISPEAHKIQRMYEEGYLFGFSIRFEPISYGAPTRDELRQHPEWKDAQTIFREWELVEYSAVTIPANPEALADAVSRGYCRPEWAERAKEMAKKEATCAGCGEAFERDADSEETRCGKCRAMPEGEDEDEEDGEETPKAKDKPKGKPAPKEEPRVYRPSETEILAVARLKMPAMARQIVRDAMHLARGRV